MHVSSRIWIVRGYKRGAKRKVKDIARVVYQQSTSRPRAFRRATRDYPGHVVTSVCLEG